MLLQDSKTQEHKLQIVQKDLKPANLPEILHTKNFHLLLPLALDLNKSNTSLPLTIGLHG